MRFRKKSVFILSIFLVSALLIKAKSQDLSFSFTEQKILLNTIEISRDSSLNQFIYLLGNPDKKIKVSFKDSTGTKYTSLKHFYSNLGIIISEDVDKNKISSIEFWYRTTRGRSYPNDSFKGKVSILGRDINQLTNPEEMKNKFPEFEFTNALGYCIFDKEDFDFTATFNPWAQGISALIIYLNK